MPTTHAPEATRRRVGSKMESLARRRNRMKRVTVHGRRGCPAYYPDDCPEGKFAYPTTGLRTGMGSGLPILALAPLTQSPQI